MSINFVPYEATLRTMRDPDHPLSKPLKCCRGAIVGLDQANHRLLLIPARCNTWACPDCAARKASLYAARLFAAKPERHIVLTCDPSKFGSVEDAIGKMKDALRKLAHKIRTGKKRRDGHWLHRPYKFEYAAIWELHQSGWPHVHLAQHGDYVPHTLLRKLWGQLTGARIVYIKSMAAELPDDHHWTKYLLKAIPTTASRFEGRRLISFSAHYDRNQSPVPKPVANPNVRWFFVRRFPVEILDILTLAYHAEELPPEKGCWQFDTHQLLLPDTETALDTWLDHSRAYSSTPEMVDDPHLPPVPLHKLTVRQHVLGF